jgi:hypothetical protein
MSLCLAAAGTVLSIAATDFTLSWMHSVEKTEWRETWRVAEAGLVLEEAAVRGSGAGMEPPPGARLVEGFYRWNPDAAPVPEVVLRRARQVGDWRLCANGRCADLGEWLGVDADPVTLSSLAPADCAGRP